MNKRRRIIILMAVAAIAVAGYLLLTRETREIKVTGIVTTDVVIVSPQIQGRLQRVCVREGDAVTNGQLLAVIQPQAWEADMSFYTSAEQQSQSQVAEAVAQLNFQESQTSNQISQADATLASVKAQAAQAAADLENARLTFEREQKLHETGAESAQAYDQ